MEPQLGITESLTPEFRDIANKVTELLTSDDLDPFYREVLGLYLDSKSTVFTSSQIEIVYSIWNSVKGKGQQEVNK